MTLRESKTIIRQYMREYYDDEHLAMLLAHAQDGKLAYMSCCCFVGIPTATHALKGATGLRSQESEHLSISLNTNTAANLAYFNLGGGKYNSYPGPEIDQERDKLRRERIIPMIHAEMRRRSKLRIAKEEKELSYDNSRV